jgi:hypothetical protein
MAQDVVDVRIYQGIHFRTADEVGRKQGERLAEWVFHHFYSLDRTTGMMTTNTMTTATSHDS